MNDLTMEARIKARTQPATSAGADPALTAGFAARVKELQRLVFHIAHGVLGDAGEAEDVTQEAFLRAYRRLAGLKDPARFRAWIGRTAYRLALNRRRANRRRLARDAAYEASRRLPIDGGRRAHDRLRVDELRRRIESLPAKLRDVVLLSAVEGLRTAEVAVILRIPEGTVRSRLHLARKRLLGEVPS